MSHMTSLSLLQVSVPHPRSGRLKVALAPGYLLNKGHKRDMLAADVIAASLVTTARGEPPNAQFALDDDVIEIDSDDSDEDEVCPCLRVACICVIMCVRVLVRVCAVYAFACVFCVPCRR